MFCSSAVQRQESLPQHNELSDICIYRRPLLWMVEGCQVQALDACLSLDNTSRKTLERAAPSAAFLFLVPM